MRQHELTSTSLMLSLTCMALLGSWGIGAAPLQASSSRSPEAENSQIVEGSKVTFQYVTTVPGSTGLDSRTTVSEFVQGRHDIFPALEHEVVGMKPGEEKQVELSPEESFGPHDDGKKLIISKTLLPPGAKQGDVLQNDVGEFATVAAVGDMSAVLDFNHPLAGKPVVVQIKILKVENP
jgi:FKBP-type peptidyl-prolyl cis-trans isomerase 2